MYTHAQIFILRWVISNLMLIEQCEGLYCVVHKQLYNLNSAKPFFKIQTQLVSVKKMTGKIKDIFITS